jgi:hypothetical protein
MSRNHFGCRSEAVIYLRARRLWLRHVSATAIIATANGSVPPEEDLPAAQPQPMDPR